MSDPGALAPQPPRRPKRRFKRVFSLAIALAAAATIAPIWLLRPMSGASALAGMTLCGPFASGSPGDGVEESGVGAPSAGEDLRLRISHVGFLGDFTGILSGGRFEPGLPVSGWVRARGFTARYTAGPGVRGTLRGTFHGKALDGGCEETLAASGSEAVALQTRFAFRLEPCGS